jgi:hypothetical protein
MNQCPYCLEPFATRGKFTIYCSRTSISEPLRGDENDNDDTVLSFCLPECACAYNYYHSHDANGDHAQNRHFLMEQVHGRCIIKTPPRNMLKTYGNHQGLTRTDWIQMCHAQLDQDDWELAQLELENVYL